MIYFKGYCLIEQDTVTMKKRGLKDQKAQRANLKAADNKTEFIRSLQNMQVCLFVCLIVCLFFDCDQFACLFAGLVRRIKEI